ncbi:MAG: TonB-dependent receptor [Burkholderiales bacterium]|nr:TonB-dependent receptor [Burkholderiales bacterium]
MMKRKSFALAAMAAAVHAAAAHAQLAAPAAMLPEVVVTGNPLGSELFELASPASVLQGTELFQRRGATLGDTLDGLPGVAATGFGPNASRPVIRGLDGDRIRILQNGAGILDASSLSFDHAVSIDPLVIERAEVVRGPAALFYGGSAVGGVVNVIDNRIPQAPVRGVTGRAETRFGGAGREKATGLVLEAGNGSFALHADVYTRDTDDLRIKGFARSARLRAADPQPVEAEGVLPNSASRSDGGAVGLSHTWARGYIGISRSGFNTVYGVVAEPDVTIDMQSSRWDLAGEVRELGRAIRSLKFKAGSTDYEHVELDAGVPATRFRNKGKDLHVEAVHGDIGPLRGAVGLQLADSDFSALGAEAFVPSTSTNAKSMFFFEELPLGNLRLTFGGRHERTEVGSEGGGNVPFGAVDLRFGAAQTRTFSGNSGALGAVWRFMPGLALAVNGSYTERAPTYYELYANGPHAATGVYEVGNSAFGKEKSKAVDIALRLQSGKHSGSISVFHNRFSNYLGLFDSGNTRGADGELNPADAGDGTSLNTGEEILPEFAYRAVPARFRGIEGEGRFRVFERGGTLDLLLSAGYVRADDHSTGQPLPRIAPWRYGAGVEYRRDRLSARVDATVFDGQNRVAAGELPTDGYTMLNATVTYRLPANGLRLEAFLRGVNLLNEEARNHVSFLKDIAPLGRRSAQVGLRGQF